jgi:hypothetical protein
MRGRNASTTLSDPAVVRRGVWRCRVPPQNGIHLPHTNVLADFFSASSGGTRVISILDKNKISDFASKLCTYLNR